MNKRLKISVVTSLVSLFMAVGGAVNSIAASAYPYVYSVMPVFEPQNPNYSYWCWAASSLISGRHSYDTNITQSDVVYHVKGSVVNETASDDEIIEAANYVTDYTCNYMRINGYANPEFFVSQFMADKVPMIKIATVNVDGSDQPTRHISVPHSIVFASDNERILCFYDPQGGYYRTANLTEFILGTYNPYGTKKWKYIGTFRH